MFSRLLLRVATRVEEFGLAELLPVRQMKLVNLFLVHLRLNPASNGIRQVTEPDRAHRLATGSAGQDGGSAYRKDRRADLFRDDCKRERMIAQEGLWSDEKSGGQNQ
jgi:hypothetical protein